MRAHLLVATLTFAAATSLGAQAGLSTISTQADSASAGGMAASVLTENVNIKTDAGTIDGMIQNCTCDGKHGGILILSSGDEQSNTLARHLSKVFAAKGVVALTYVVPKTTNADAIAATDVLRHRGDVAPDKIGVIGLGDAAMVAADVAKSQALRYAVGIDETIDPATFGKLSQKTLLIQGTDDAFSDNAEKRKATVQKHARNLTYWLAPSNDVTGLNAEDSALLSRITDWVADRNS